MWAILLSLAPACKQSAPQPLYNIVQSAKAEKAMVVSAHPLATKVGVEILKQGGNAVDAMVATQFALAVVYPRAGNIGGGGFMVIRNKDGAISSIDYREKAPAAASRDMYLDEEGNVINGLSQSGHLAVGIPGAVDGLIEAHKKHGKIKDLATLIEPSVRLAANGYALSVTEANRLNRFAEAFAKYNDASTTVFMKDTEWKEGDLLVQKELAKTLERIRDNGREGFYEGKTAELLVAEMQQGNGLISLQDLKDYRSKWREPVVGNYKDFKVISMPPPSSGGIALLQLLHMVEPYPLNEWGFHSTKAVHLMAEAERRVYADRAEHLGDSDFYNVPQDSMLSEAYLDDRMADFNEMQATSSDKILAGNFEIGLESFETTHTSIIDAEGNAASCTTTLNSNFGSKVVVDGAGFFLNNEMDDFSAKPGVPNQFGLVGAEANAIQPGKRMLSSMTPTIVEKDGEVFMVLGAPGGSTIITAVFQVFMNVVEFDMNLEQAVRAARFHHQWLPDNILVEKEALDSTTRQALQDMGHKFREVNSMAVIKAIHQLPDGTLHGVGDQRNPDDHAMGY